jgi:RimJ/RimL family protein N-acetyltransferase
MIQPQQIELRNGDRATFREIRSDDASRLIKFFRRLSLETIRYRFFMVRNEPSLTEAEFLATVDYICRMAVVVTLPREDEEDIVGIAQYDSAYAPESDQAELAIVVQDDYQHSGLGRLLLKRLVDYGRGSGLREIYGSVLVENYRMQRFLASSGYPVKFEYRDGDLYFRLDLDARE